MDKSRLVGDSILRPTDILNIPFRFEDEERPPLMLRKSQIRAIKYAREHGIDYKIKPDEIDSKLK